MYDPQQAANMVTQGVSDLGAPIQGAMELPPFIQQLMDGVARGELDPDHAGMMANGHVQQMAGNIPGLRAAMGGAAPMQQSQPMQAPPTGVSPTSYGPLAPGGARAGPGAMVSGPAFNTQQAPVQRAQPQVRTYGDLAMLERVAPTLSKMKNDKVALKQLDIADRQLRADEERKRKTSEGEANRGARQEETDKKLQVAYQMQGRKLQNDMAMLDKKLRELRSLQSDKSVTDERKWKAAMAVKMMATGLEAQSRIFASPTAPALGVTDEIAPFVRGASTKAAEGHQLADQILNGTGPGTARETVRETTSTPNGMKQIQEAMKKARPGDVVQGVGGKRLRRTSTGWEDAS
jgi:hypothetical protein